MITPIGEFIVIEEYNGQKHPTSMDIFDKDSTIRILKKAEGSSVVVYESTAEKFLTRVHCRSSWIGIKLRKN